MNLSQIGELESGALSRHNTVEVRSQRGGGRLWRDDEYEGISHGVQSIIHGCERALEGLEWLENALTTRTTSGDVMGAGSVGNLYEMRSSQERQVAATTTTTGRRRCATSRIRTTTMRRAALEERLRLVMTGSV